jgi:hypothetical protein
MPERSGLPSRALGVGADRFGLPSAVLGTSGVGYDGHCAATDAEAMMTNATVGASRRVIGADYTRAARGGWGRE